MPRLIYFLLLAVAGMQISASAQTISSFSPASGNVGTVVSVKGSGFNKVTAVSIGSGACLLLDKTESTIRLMVMSNAATGSISISGGAVVRTSQYFTVTTEPLNTAQQGLKLVDTTRTNVRSQGSSIALSADGNTLAVGCPNDSGYGVVCVYIRKGSDWSLQARLRCSGAASRSPRFGVSVALSADGNTLAAGGWSDIEQINWSERTVGATWIFTRTDSTWSQQGEKLVGKSEIYRFARQGASVALSADGNTLAVGSRADTLGKGAVWIFSRANSVWSQQGDCLVASGVDIRSYSNFSGSDVRSSLTISADGNTIAVGIPTDNQSTGSVSVFTRNEGVWKQHGYKLIGSLPERGGYRGGTVAISADGKTVAMGGPETRRTDTFDFSGNLPRESGATWVFTKSDTGWVQQGDWLVADNSYRALGEGTAVSLSADGNMLAVGAPGYNSYGFAQLYLRTGATWKPYGQGFRCTDGWGASGLGAALALSADGRTLAVSGPNDHQNKGAAWIFSGASNDGIIASLPEPSAPAFFWPNPATNLITISGGFPVGLVRIIDVHGRIVLGSGYKSGETIDLSALVPALYWIQLDDQKAVPLLKW
jgi:hypothetical protein